MVASVTKLESQQHARRKPETDENGDHPTFDEGILTDLTRQAVASVVGIAPHSPDANERLIPPPASKRLRQSDSAVLPSNATIEYVIACFQSNVNKLDSRLDKIHDFVAGRSKENLTVAEVAEMTGCSAYTVRRRISDGRLRASRVRNTGERGRLLIYRDELRRLINGGLDQDL